MKNNWFRFSSLSILFCWFAIFAIVPFLLILICSFLTSSDSHLFVWHFSLQSYVQLFNPIYFRILWQSAWLALLVTAICLTLGYPVAYWLSRWDGSWRYVLLTLMIIPFWTSSLIRTYAVLTLLKAKGLLNSLLIALGIIHHPLQLIYSNTAVIIGMVYNLLPFMVLPLYANLEKLDHKLLEAAKDLGAGRYHTFVHVLLPLSSPGIFAGSLLVLLPAMTLFYIPSILGGAKSLLLGNLIESQFLQMHDWPGGAATSMVLTFMMLLLLFIYRKMMRGKGDMELLS